MKVAIASFDDHLISAAVDGLGQATILFAGTSRCEIVRDGPANRMEGIRSAPPHTRSDVRRKSQAKRDYKVIHSVEKAWELKIFTPKTVKKLRNATYKLPLRRVDHYILECVRRNPEATLEYKAGWCTFHGLTLKLWPQYQLPERTIPNFNRRVIIRLIKMMAGKDTKALAEMLHLFETNQTYPFVQRHFSARISKERRASQRPKPRVPKDVPIQDISDAADMEAEILGNEAADAMACHDSWKRVFALDGIDTDVYGTGSDEAETEEEEEDREVSEEPPQVPLARVPDDERPLEPPSAEEPASTAIGLAIATSVNPGDDVDGVAEDTTLHDSLETLLVSMAATRSALHNVEIAAAEAAEGT